jgi:hypothetical protein
MRPSYTKLFLCLSLGLTGCADGPLFLELAFLNPYHRQNWADDEKYGPTFYTRIGEIQGVREGADQLTRQQQQHLAQQLTEIVQFDENPQLRREATLALGALATPDAVAGLRVAVSDQDAIVRIAACRSWGERGGPEAVTLLAGIVNSDQDLDVRMAATKQLGNFSEPAALEALGVALDDSDPALQFRAVQSLKKSTRRSYGNSVVAWRQYLQGGTPPPPNPSLVERMTNLF